MTMYSVHSTCHSKLISERAKPKVSFNVFNDKRKGKTNCQTKVELYDSLKSNLRFRFFVHVLQMKTFPSCFLDWLTFCSNHIVFLICTLFFCSCSFIFHRVFFLCSTSFVFYLPVRFFVWLC